MPTERSDKPITEIFDRGRRGEPLIGCDCVSCFGYCCINRDVARREVLTVPEVNDA